MAPKRGHDESSPITYSSNVLWLHSLIREPNHGTTVDDFSLAPYDPAQNEFTDDNIIWEASKIAYLLYHSLSTRNSQVMILSSIGIDTGSAKERAWNKALSTKQSQWKAAILNKFLFPHVQELVRKWQVANPWKSFAVLPADDRHQIWMESYDKDPKGTSISMFKPIIGTLDTHNVFNPELDSEDDRAKMKAVRLMLRNKYLYGCEITYKHRVLANKKDACFAEWVAYAENESFSSTIVAVTDLPIFAELPQSQTISASKKKKKLCGP